MVLTKKLINDISKVNNDNIYKIDGWFYQPDICIFDFLLSLQNNLNIDGNLLEIGVWKGRSLFKILNYCKNNEILFGLDAFLKKEEIESQYKNFNNTNKIKLICDSSNNIINYKEINNIRFCHIDGGHNGLTVYNDIINANNYTNDKAIIILDDFSKEYISIMQAYYKAYFTNQINFVPIIYTPAKLYLCHKNSYQLYYEQIKNNIVNFINNYNDNHNIKQITSYKDTNITDMFRITDYYGFLADFDGKYLFHNF